MATTGRDSALSDFSAGFSDWPLWIRFGWYDVVSRYRRSWVGPLWLIATNVIFVVALGAVYSILFKQSLENYMPFVAVGTVVWGYVSVVASESLQTFVESEVYIRQVRRSPVVYACRVVWRNVIVLMNQFVVALVVTIVFNKFSLSHLPLVVLGLFLLILQALWLSILLGILGTRFRDLMPIVQNILQITFFITPVIWPPSALGESVWVAEINPVFHLIEIVRLPMLGQVPSLISYIMVLALTAAGAAVAFWFYAKFRQRIVYWL